MEIESSIDGIEQYSTDVASRNIQDGVAIKMMKNAMDIQKQQGAMLTKMMEQSVNPHIGGNIDIRL